ncbi:putative pectate lyase a protein [Botrytis fragariae]|uniref:pectate lyase n=1 Tax=Botrytis fragariae TaxID=1964551 RepID=A0A8H6B5Z8_9HELO|nr:putative pectate lyase a protein [Botrytis fragariae]KAF5879592.1 putative pectate lyase a protein [Botrytis fragariae]
MKFSIVSAGLLAAFATAAPTPTSDEIVNRAAIAKRATVTDACTIGYASTNGGTKGGAGGTTTTVSTYAQFTKAATAGNTVVVVSGPITQAASQVKVASDTTIIGKNSKVVFTGFGLLVKEQSNVIIRNIAIKEVLAANGDALGIQKSTNVWVDHVDLSSNRDHDKDYYDGLFDVTHASDYVTLSNSFIHDHWKASLVGHSDSNSAEDKGHLRVTYANNYWKNVNSRGPSIRFGTAHIYNSYHDTVADGINTRLGAQVLVESNAWTGSKKPLYSTDAGYAVANDNDFGTGSNEAEKGTLSASKLGYTYTLLGSSKVKAAVVGTAGVTLSF